MIPELTEAYDEEDVDTAFREAARKLFGRLRPEFNDFVLWEFKKLIDCAIDNRRTELRSLGIKETDWRLK